MTSDMMSESQPDLQQIDPQIFDLIRSEEERQDRSIRLIAS